MWDRLLLVISLPPSTQAVQLNFEIMAKDDWLPGGRRKRLLNAEWTESYQSGGFHPVDIGDKFKGNRYTIVRKLGHGSSSTVWLAQDTMY